MSCDNLDNIDNNSRNWLDLSWPDGDIQISHPTSLTISMFNDKLKEKYANLKKIYKILIFSIFLILYIIWLRFLILIYLEKFKTLK